MIGPGGAIVAATRRHPGPLVTVGAGIVAVAALCLGRGERRFWSFLLVTAILAAIVSLLDRRWRLPRAQAWMVATLAVLHLAGGLVPSPTAASLYETWIIEGVLKFDQAVHLFGSAVAMTVAVRLFARRANGLARAALAAFGVGIANEIVELLLASNVGMLRRGGWDNTGWDLVFNGAGIAVVLIHEWTARERSTNRSV